MTLRATVPSVMNVLDHHCNRNCVQNGRLRPTSPAIYLGRSEPVTCFDLNARLAPFFTCFNSLHLSRRSTLKSTDFRAVPDPPACRKVLHIVSHCALGFEHAIGQPAIWPKISRFKEPSVLFIKQLVCARRCTTSRIYEPYSRYL